MLVAPAVLPLPPGPHLMRSTMMRDDDELETADGFDVMADAIADDEPEHVGMVRRERFKTSAEAEEAERIYLESLLSTDLNTAALPILFYDEQGNPDPLSKADVKDLMDRFGISEAEFLELMKP